MTTYPTNVLWECCGTWSRTVSPSTPRQLANQQCREVYSPSPAQFYDPLGLANPFVLKAKVLFQELCRRKLDWDEKIPESMTDRWNKWLADLPQLSALTVPRCLKSATPDDSSAVQLHHFSDASETAYGAVSYLRMNKKCKLVMSKARLAPIKPTTIL